MVTEVKAFKTPGGALFPDREAALKAEDAENLANFASELRADLHIDGDDWEDDSGGLWAKILYENPMILNKLYSKYKRL